MANRRAMAQVFPESFATHRIRPVDDYPRRLLAALRAAAPPGRADPTVVVLTPGIYNSAYFEHALLARTMGVELVEGRDLVCSGGQVMMRTTSGQRRVDVIYRRVDDDFLDPVHFRADSLLGCPGLVTAARARNVTVANAIGNGVADDKLVYTYVPELIRFYLGEEPLLANVDTYRLEEPADRAEVLDPPRRAGRQARGRLRRQGPGDRAAGHPNRAGGAACPRGGGSARLDRAAVIHLSTVPTFADGRLRPRHVDLRPFAVNDGHTMWVLPGGLTRVALPEGQLVVNSSQGGGSKDTWVLAEAAERPRGRAGVTLVPAQRPMPMREPDRGPPPSRPGSATAAATAGPAAPAAAGRAGERSC